MLFAWSYVYQFHTIPACDTHTNRQTNNDGYYPRIACAARERVKTEWWGAGMFMCQRRLVHWLTILINADRLTTWWCLQLEMSTAAVCDLRWLWRCSCDVGRLFTVHMVIKLLRRVFHSLMIFLNFNLWLLLRLAVQSRSGQISTPLCFWMADQFLIDC